MDDNDERTFRRLQLRIRTLTTLLSELMPADYAHDRMDTMSVTRAATFTMLSNNVAVLLNTGSYDAIAVSPAALTVNLGIALVGVIQRDDDSAPDVEMYHAQETLPTSDSYIQAVLDIFHPAAADDDRFAALMPLMLEHCHHKIGEALCFSEFIFSRPIEHVLAECQPTTSDRWEVFVSVPDAVAHLLAGITNRRSLSPGSKDFRLGSDNILQWTAALAAQYALLRDVFLDIDGADVLNSRCLYFFLTSVFCNDTVLQTLMVRTDFIDRLSAVYSPPSPELFARLGDSIGDCEAIRAMTRAQQVNHFVRACLSMSTSWRRTVIYLVILHRVSRGPATMGKITFCLVRAPRPDTEMEDVTTLLARLKLDVQDERVKSLSQFRGSIHNEALLLALKTNAQAVDVGEECKALFMYGDNDRSMGMAHKPCFCCHLLAEDLGFRLPGTCGRILPWSPPKGLDVEVLQRMVFTLERKLMIVLR